MPLRLKSLELHGYKTFAAKTNFSFAEGITAIVGPNGSGKSNIADALRWVLGEQSYSLLRAKKTEDMIFAGSEFKPRAGMASAGITFDNSDGWLPVDFSEVGLSRRAYRDGRNEYLLNNQHVRLKDINELLAQSGLSERTYTILGQGLVDASLALKADERRRLFEEAAGIGLYRARREETLRRLDTSQRNLDRVLDILAELEPRLKSLERQAGRAREYAQIQADLRLLLHEWYGYHLHNAQRELTETINLARSQELKLNETRAAYQKLREEYSSFRDKLNELRAKLNSWHKQSAQLHEKRETISGELAVLDERQRSLLGTRISVLSDQARLQEECNDAREKIDLSKKEMARLLAEMDEAAKQATMAQDALSELQTKKKNQETANEIARKKIDEKKSEKANILGRLKEVESRFETLRKNHNNLVDDLGKAQAEQDLANSKHKDAAKVVGETSQTALLAESNLKVTQKSLEVLEEQAEQVENEITKKHAEEARLTAQLDVFEQAENSFAGYAEGAKLILEAGRSKKINGVLGVLSTALEVPAELEVAIAAALGEYSDATLLDSAQNTDRAIAILEMGQSSRAALLPMDSIAPAKPILVKVGGGIIGNAVELIKAPDELRPILDLLLGQALIVKDLESAKKILPSQEKNARVITLAGEVFHATGQVFAGKPPKASTLGRPRVKRELLDSRSIVQEHLKQLEGKFTELTRNIEKAREKLKSDKGVLILRQSENDAAREAERQASYQVEKCHQRLDWLKGQKASLDADISRADSEKINLESALAVTEKEGAIMLDAFRKTTTSFAEVDLGEHQEQATYWGTRLAVAEHSKSEAEKKAEERNTNLTHLEKQKTTMEFRIYEIDQMVLEIESERASLRGSVAGMNSSLEELRNLIGPAERELEISDRQELELKIREGEGQANLARGERTNNQIQLDLGRKQEYLRNLRLKIEDDFGLVAFNYANDVSGPVPLPFDGMVDQLPVVDQLNPDLEDQINRQRAQLRRMGAINPDAQQEFAAVKERHAFLTNQLDDLKRAESDLRKVISELDELTRQEFQKTFDAVAEQFHVIFHRLFGGGSARLELTEPDNLTDTGIDIEARLPGRREQGLSLLSGGERSLTAIALVFALLKVSPTPVCVMDEVDAMLDEANVGRFRDLLLELSKDTQFIIITHNRNTVQAADVIYGVTMGRDSSSQIISLKLDDISEEYLK